LTRLLRAAGVPTVRLDGVKADSVIGALCAEPVGNVLTVIVSSDHDFHQLVGERVRVFDDVKKKLWDAAAVKAHYGLREPREVSAYKALVGDLSDGVKGVYRCGPVKARKVCTVLRRLVREAPYIHRLSVGPAQPGDRARPAVPDARGPGGGGRAAAGSSTSRRPGWPWPSACGGRLCARSLTASASSATSCATRWSPWWTGWRACATGPGRCDGGG
jgi:hypothetical protein